MALALALDLERAQSINGMAVRGREDEPENTEASISKYDSERLNL